MESNKGFKTRRMTEKESKWRQMAVRKRKRVLKRR